MFILPDWNEPYTRAHIHNVVVVALCVSNIAFIFVQFQQCQAMPCHEPYTANMNWKLYEQMDEMRWACRKWRITNYEFLSLSLILHSYVLCSSISFNIFSPSALWYIFLLCKNKRNFRINNGAKKGLAAKGKIEQIKYVCLPNLFDDVRQSALWCEYVRMRWLRIHSLSG